MTCKLDLTGKIVVGGNGCGCGGSSGNSGPSKMQPLSLGCGAIFSALQSTDCAVGINSPSAFIPVPGVSLSSVEFLYLQASSAVTLRWGGTYAAITGTAVLGGVTFVGAEVFEVELPDLAGALVSFETTFTAGNFTLQQVANLINAAAITASLGYMPAALNGAGTALVITAGVKGKGKTVTVLQALALIGFATVNQTGDGTDPTEVRTQSFLNQWPSGEGVADLEIKGVAEVTALAGGT